MNFSSLLGDGFISLCFTWLAEGKAADRDDLYEAGMRETSDLFSATARFFYLYLISYSSRSYFSLFDSNLYYYFSYLKINVRNKNTYYYDSCFFALFFTYFFSFFCPYHVFCFYVFFLRKNLNYYYLNSLFFVFLILPLQLRQHLKIFLTLKMQIINFLHCFLA